MGYPRYNMMKRAARFALVDKDRCWSLADFGKPSPAKVAGLLAIALASASWSLTKTLSNSFRLFLSASARLFAYAVLYSSQKFHFPLLGSGLNGIRSNQTFTRSNKDFSSSAFLIRCTC